MNPNDLPRARVSEAIQDELRTQRQWDRYVAAEQAELESISRTLTSSTSISGLARMARA